MGEKKKQSQTQDLLPPEAPADVAQPPSGVDDKRQYTPNPVVTEIPIACPRCKSTKSKVTKTTSFPHRPLQIAGKTYPGRIVRRRICRMCARHFVSNAPLEVEPPLPKPVPCATCKGSGALPRTDKRKKAILCPDCNGSGVLKEATENTEEAQESPTP